MLQRCDEYLAVTDLACFGTFNNRLDNFLYTIIGDRNLDLGLGQKIHNVLGATIEFRVSTLPAESLDLTNRHTLHTNFTQGIPDVVQSKGFNDCCYKLHAD